MKKSLLTLLPAVLSLSLALASLLGATPALAQAAASAPAVAPAAAPATGKGAPTARSALTAKVVTPSFGPADVSGEPSAIGPSMNLTIGKSTLMRMPSAVSRISLGNPNVADVTLISPTELYLLGKTYGSTNLIVWRKGGGPTAIDVNVNIDHGRMEDKIRELLPAEREIRVRPAADSVILTGMVTSAVKARAAEDIANAFVRDVNKSLVLPTAGGDGKGGQGGGGGGGGAAAANVAGSKVVNLLQIAEAQQVMLEVKIAEVSKTLLDKFGLDFSRMVTSADGLTSRFLSGIIGGGAGILGRFNPNQSANIVGSASSTITAGSGEAATNLITQGKGASLLNLDLIKKDGIVKILAEPNIVAISGQEASFLAGGKIFIPVGRSNATGGTTITLEEKEFGVGLKFTPTVLEGGRIHLKVSPEVSELSQTGSPFTTVGGETAILPSFTTRRVQTSVQLMDGQSLAIAGLIKNNVTESVNKVPGLGEVPVMGALFRSSEFQGDRTELMFVITPRLIKPLDANYILPTDGFTPPSRSEFYFGNKLEGSGHQDIPADPRAAPASPLPASSTGGMEVK